MASGSDLGKKEAYYLRLQLLLMTEGKAVLKAIFDRSIPPQDLHKKLNERNVKKTIDIGLEKNRISDTQYDRIFTKHKPPSSEKFDISLLVFFLRNLDMFGMKKSKWWHVTDNSKIPDRVDVKDADIVRIRNMRNLMNHKDIASLEEAEFENMWELTEKALLRLAVKYNIPDQKQKIADIKAKLDLVTEEMRSIRANTEIFLEKFQNDDLYVETAAFRKAKALLEDNHIVILTGHPGEGKTNMAAALALNFNNPSNCLKLSRPSEWRKIDLKLRLIGTLIIDDIFGPGALDQNLVGEWRQYLPEIERAAKGKYLRVIITSRHYIFEESKEELGALPMFKDENDTVLLLTSVNLTHDEKTKILKNQATRNKTQISDDDLKMCIEASKGPTEENGDFLFGFPECASMFVRSENLRKKGADFFKRPASFFKRCLEDLYVKKERDKFLALVAVWAKDNKRLSEDELRSVPNASTLVKKVAEVFDCQLNKKFLENIKSSLDSHVGGYLVFTEATGEYSFSHNIIGDMVGLVVGEKKPLEAVEICPRDFFMEYVTIDEGMRDEFRLIVKERHALELAKKCVNLLLRRGCNTIVEHIPENEFQTLSRKGKRSNDIVILNTIDFGIIKHKCFKSEKIVKTFIDYAISEDVVADVFNVPVMKMRGYFFEYGISVDQLDMCLLGYAWYSGANVFAEEVIKREILRAENFDRSVSLLLATHSAQKDSVEFLLEHGAKVTGDVIYIAMHKNVEILKRLLEQPGTNVNDRGNAVKGNYPLIIAARKGFVDVIKTMLDFDADLGVQNTARMTALHKAIIYKHWDITKLLVDAGAPLEKKDVTFKRTPLHLAVDMGRFNLVDHLLNKGASLMAKDHRGHYPIHIAAIQGNIPIVQKLFAADRKQDQLRIASYGTKSCIKGMSLFHIAVWKKNGKLIDELIALGADPNVQDFYGQTPLFFAIMKKLDTIAHKLIAYERSDKRKAQKQRYTPLHAAIHVGLNNIAKELMKYSDVNARDKYGKTPLHVACEKANIGLITILLQNYGADPRIITKRGDTVHHILRRCKTKQRYMEYSAIEAEQLISKFDPGFAQQLPNLKNESDIVIGPRRNNRNRTGGGATTRYTLARLPNEMELFFLLLLLKLDLSNRRGRNEEIAVRRNLGDAPAADIEELDDDL